MREPSTAMRISIVRIITRPPTRLVMLPRTPAEESDDAARGETVNDCLRLLGAEAH